MGFKRFIYLFIICFFSSSVFAQGSKARITSEAQHPLRHWAERVKFDDTLHKFDGRDNVQDALQAIATGDVVDTIRKDLTIFGDTYVQGDFGVSGTATADEVDVNSLIVDTTTLVANVPSYEDKVGIGTATPQSLLHINKANGAGDVGLIIQNDATTANETASVIFRTTTSTADFASIQAKRFDADEADLLINVAQGGAASLHTIFERDGDVGIGTATPLAPLHVSTATDGAKQILQTFDSTTGNYTGTLFKISANALDQYHKGGIFFERTGGSAVGSIHLATDNTANSSNADLADARLTIEAGGDVGIGITNPTEALTIGNGGKLQVNSAGDDKNVIIEHTDTSGLISTSSGSLILEPSGSLVTIRDDNLDIMSFDITEDDGPILLRLRAQGVQGQCLFGVTDSGGNQLIISNLDNLAKDHGIPVAADPLFAVFSDDDVDVSDNRSIRFGHDGNDGNITTGALTGAGSSPATITNNLNLAPTGDVIFVGSGVGLPYGSLYMHEATQTIDLVQNTYVKVTGWTTGLLNNVTVASDDLLINTAGVYKVDWSISCDPTNANQSIDVDIFKEGAEQPDGATRRNFGTANAIGNMGGTALLDCAVGDNIDLRMKNNTSSTDVDIYDSNINVVMVGG